MQEPNHNAFWSIRPYRIIGSYPINEWKEKKQLEMPLREQRVQDDRDQFFNSEIGLQISEHDAASQNEGSLLAFMGNK